MPFVALCQLSKQALRDLKLSSSQPLPGSEQGKEPQTDFFRLETSPDWANMELVFSMQKAPDKFLCSAGEPVLGVDIIFSPSTNFCCIHWPSVPCLMSYRFNVNLVAGRQTILLSAVSAGQPEWQVQ